MASTSEEEWDDDDDGAGGWVDGELGLPMANIGRRERGGASRAQVRRAGRRATRRAAKAATASADASQEGGRGAPDSRGGGGAHPGGMGMKGMGEDGSDSKGITPLRRSLTSSTAGPPAATAKAEGGREGKRWTTEGVYNRLAHDASFAAEEWVMGVMDRFLGLLEVPFHDFRRIRDDLVEGIPMHRVEYFANTVTGARLTRANKYRELNALVPAAWRGAGAGVASHAAADGDDGAA